MKILGFIMIIVGFGSLHFAASALSVGAHSTSRLWQHIEPLSDAAIDAAEDTEERRQRYREVSIAKRELEVYTLEVDSEATRAGMALTVIAMLQFSSEFSRDCDILYFLISSPGGSVDYGIALYNYLRALPCSIIMHNIGSVESIANIVFLAGDLRLAAPHTRFLLHGIFWQPPAGAAIIPAQVAEAGTRFRDDEKMNTSGLDLAGSNFGEADAKKMPSHLFHGALTMDYGSAVRADISKQDYSVCPRHWYVDATFKCTDCGSEFRFSAQEQRFWYEDRRFYVDSQPKRCVACRKKVRQRKLDSQEPKSPK